MPFDSTIPTMAHISDVRAKMEEVVRQLRHRELHHDESKLEEPEKSILDEWTPKLNSVPYGSQQYWDMLAESEMDKFLEHHYSKNPHHPQYHPNGVNDMSLIDLIEMLCDWAAAVKRHDDGDLAKSIEINQERFGIDPQLAGILENTKRELGW